MDHGGHQLIERELGARSPEAASSLRGARASFRGVEEAAFSFPAILLGILLIVLVPLLAESAGAGSF
jgi:hypothetical protein